MLAPRVPAYVAVLMALLTVYACVSYIMYKRILHLNEQAAGAQNQLSGELSDSVANILAVKTYGREDYERSLFDQANREVVARDSKRMRASLLRGVITACIAVTIMSVVTVFIAGGNAWFGITPARSSSCSPTPTPSRTSSTSSQRPAAVQPRLRRRQRHDGHARRAAPGG